MPENRENPDNPEAREPRIDIDDATRDELATQLSAIARALPDRINADPQRVERDVRLRGELPGSVAPGLAVLAGPRTAFCPPSWSAEPLVPALVAARRALLADGGAS